MTLPGLDPVSASDGMLNLARVEGISATGGRVNPAHVPLNAHFCHQ